MKLWGRSEALQSCRLPEGLPRPQIGPSSANEVTRQACWPSSAPCPVSVCGKISWAGLQLRALLAVVGSMQDGHHTMAMH